MNIFQDKHYTTRDGMLAAIVQRWLTRGALDKSMASIEQRLISDSDDVLAAECLGQYRLKDIDEAELEAAFATYRSGFRPANSFDDALTRAAETLSMRHQDMTVLVSFDPDQASAPIRYDLGLDDEESWQPTPYQTADANHSREEAKKLVQAWLDDMDS